MGQVTPGRALVCPYCGTAIGINLVTIGNGYLSRDVPDSIECEAPDCGAMWDPTGLPQEAPRWERWPELYSPPDRAVARA